MKKLCILVPCYNEEETLPNTQAILQQKLYQLITDFDLSPDSTICWVDDGSSDKTWDLIEEFSVNNTNSMGLKLSRNFGHQYAVYGGLQSVKNEFDLFITIDADLQDDIAAMDKMLAKNKEGFAVVYGVRNDRSTDGVFKRFSALFFYKIMSFMGVESVYNHADYRLIEKKVLDSLLDFKEYHLYLRGIFPKIGFPSTQVHYKRLERTAGETKYSLGKMLSLAWNGITSFSTKPLKIVMISGLFFSFLAFAGFCWITYVLIAGKNIAGWASTILPIMFFGGIQMIFMGVIGEYVGKIYEQVKDRPRFIIEKMVK